MSWMLYGATGATGRRIAEVSARSGERPILAARSNRVIEVARRLGLDYRVFTLEDPARVREALDGVELVLNAAGPFIATAEGMIDACLSAGAHYLDITGELPVFRSSAARDAEAAMRGVAIINGVGFDVIPSDALALHLATRYPNARSIDLVVDAVTSPTAGTLLSTLGVVRTGGWRRERGKLVATTLGTGARQLRLPWGVRTVLPSPLGDLVTIWRSTGIGTITTWLGVPEGLEGLVRRFGRGIVRGLELTPLRALAKGAIRAFGPEKLPADDGRAYFYALVETEEGDRHAAWCTTEEPYGFTARWSLEAVRRTLEQRPAGYTTPAQLLGTAPIEPIELF